MAQLYPVEAARSFDGSMMNSKCHGVALLHRDDLRPRLRTGDDEGNKQIAEAKLRESLLMKPGMPYNESQRDVDFNTLNRGGHFAAWELHGGSVRRLSFVATTDLNKGAVAAALFEMT